MLNSAYEQFVTICQPSVTEPGSREEGGNSAGVCLQHAEIKKTKQNTTTAAAFLQAGGCTSVCTFFFHPSKTTASERQLLLSSKKQQFETKQEAISVMCYFILFIFTYYFTDASGRNLRLWVWPLWRKGFWKVSLLVVVCWRFCFLNPYSILLFVCESHKRNNWHWFSWDKKHHDRWNYRHA